MTDKDHVGTLSEHMAAMVALRWAKTTPEQRHAHGLKLAKARAKFRAAKAKKDA
jgi:hypothetical protein